jgi:hypothetical protein
MRPIMILGLAASLLVLGTIPALADGWTSTAPASHRVGPKFGDHLKAKKTPTPAPKKEKKGS